MHSIIGYIREYGEKSIEEMPLNEVDSLILNQLSYLKYDGILPAYNETKKGLTLTEVGAHEGFERLFEDRRYAGKNRELFDVAAKSTRFGRMLLNHYINIIDESWEIQFSAMTFTFENGEFYLAYRGTDETMTGWKEDFNMALFTPVPAQEKAVQYLHAIAAKSAGQFTIGGHSKGGNLAVYAATKCVQEVRNRIRLIYNHDGPGFPKDTIMETEAFAGIRERIRKFMPRSSIVGMLMESHEPYEIVECRNFGILQHDPYNWIVDGTGFRLAEEVHEYVAMKDASINKWVEGMTPEETKVFVDTLYAVLTSAGAKTLLDLMDDWKGNSKAMAEAIGETDAKTKEMLLKIFAQLANAMQTMMKDKAKEKIRTQIEKWQISDKNPKK